MNNRPLLWLIYLLTYSDAECVLVGSRGQFGVNWGLSDGDQILMEIVYVFKGHGAKGWGLWGLNKLLEKLQETSTTATACRISRFSTL